MRLAWPKINQMLKEEERVNVGEVHANLFEQQ